jgi:hypothetical protein
VCWGSLQQVEIQTYCRRGRRADGSDVMNLRVSKCHYLLYLLYNLRYWYVLCGWHLSDNKNNTSGGHWVNVVLNVVAGFRSWWKESFRCPFSTGCLW